MIRPVPILAALLAAAACDRPPPEPLVTVEDARVALPAVPGRPGAAYFTLRTTRDARLTGIASPRIGRIELHETVAERGMSRMRPLAGARLAPDAPLAFEPGGRHAMLFELDPALRPGGTVTLTFRFDAAPPATVEAEIRGPGEISGHEGR